MYKKIDQTVVLQYTKIIAAPYSSFVLNELYFFLISVAIYSSPILQPVYSIFAASVLTMTNIAVCQQIGNITLFISKGRHMSSLTTQWLIQNILEGLLVKKTFILFHIKNAISKHAIFWIHWAGGTKTILKTSQRI